MITAMKPRATIDDRIALAATHWMQLAASSIAGAQKSRVQKSGLLIRIATIKISTSINSSENSYELTHAFRQIHPRITANTETTPLTRKPRNASGQLDMRIPPFSIFDLIGCFADPFLIDGELVLCDLQ